MKYFILTVIIAITHNLSVLLEDCPPMPSMPRDMLYDSWKRKFDEFSLENFWRITIGSCIDYEHHNTTQYSECENENISHRLDQLYAERFEDPSSRIMKETVFKSPKLSTPYKLTLIETYQAHKSDFDEVEKNVESYYTKLVIINIKNLLIENKNNISKVLVEDCIRTDQNVSMLINALGSHLEFLTKANLHIGCYMKQKAGDKAFRRRFNISRMVDQEINSRTNEKSLSFNIFYTFIAIMCFLFEIKN